MCFALNIFLFFGTTDMTIGQQNGAYIGISRILKTVCCGAPVVITGRADVPRLLNIYNKRRLQYEKNKLAFRGHRRQWRWFVRISNRSIQLLPIRSSTNFTLSFNTVLLHKTRYRRHDFWNWVWCFFWNERSSEFRRILQGHNKRGLIPFSSQRTMCIKIAIFLKICFWFYF